MVHGVYVTFKMLQVSKQVKCQFIWHIGKLSLLR